MNIFFLHPKPTRCARWHCDKHVVKMLLETVQLLYTAHWVLAAERNEFPALASAPPRKSEPGSAGYRSIHNWKHPCAIWVRGSLQHYRWLTELGLALAVEFRHRFGDKAHSCEAHILWLYWNPPAQLADRGWSSPPLAMPDEYRVSKNPVVSYRTYYLKGKGSRGLLTYTARCRPHWIARPLPLMEYHTATEGAAGVPSGTAHAGTQGV